MAKNNLLMVFGIIAIVLLFAGGIYYFGGFTQTKSFEGGTCLGTSTIEMSYHLDAAQAPSLVNTIAACTPPSNIIQQGSSAIEAWTKQNNPTWTGKLEVLVTSPTYPSYTATLCSKTGTFHCGYNYVAGGSDDCNYKQIPSAGNGNYVFTVGLYPSTNAAFFPQRSTFTFNCAGAAKTCSYGGKTYTGGGNAVTSCLSTQPKYCDSSGQIIDMADICGCPSGMSELGGTSCSAVCQEQGHSKIDHCEGNILWYGATCASPGAAYTFQKQDCSATGSTCTLITDSQNMPTGAGCSNQNTPIINSNTCTNSCASGDVRTAYPDCVCKPPQLSLQCVGTKPANSCEGNTLRANYECSQTTGQWTPAFSFDCGSLNCIDGVCTTQTTGGASGSTTQNGDGSATCSDYTLPNECSQVQIGYRCDSGTIQLVQDTSCIINNVEPTSPSVSCTGDSFSVCANNDILVKTVCGADGQYTVIGGIPTDCSALGLQCVDDTCKAGTIMPCTSDIKFTCADKSTIVLKQCTNGQLTITQNKCSSGKQPDYCSYKPDDLTCVINSHLLEIGGVAILILLIVVAVYVYMNMQKRRRR